MRKNKNKLSWKATIAFIVLYIVALACILGPFLAFSSLDDATSDDWETVADIGSWAVIIAVFAEFPEIIVKASVGSRKRWARFRLFLMRFKRIGKIHFWLEKHEFQIDVFALAAWVFIMVGLAVELRANQHARAKQDADFVRVSTNASSANERAAKLEKEAQSFRLKANELELKAETLRSNNDALTEKTAQFAMIITKTENELEQQEYPMDFTGLPPIITGLPSPFFHELIQIPHKPIMLLNTVDIRAKWTANKLGDCLRLAGWNVTNQEVAISWLGIYIGVDGWFHSMENDLKNWPKTFPPNEQVNTGLRLLQLLTSNELPATIGELIQGNWLLGNSWPPPSNLGIAIPTNTILILVGQRPLPLQTKRFILEAKKQLLDAEYRATKNRGVEKRDGDHYTTLFSPADQTNLFQIQIERLQLNKEDEELQQQELPILRHNRIHPN